MALFTETEQNVRDARANLDPFLSDDLRQRVNNDPKDKNLLKLLTEAFKENTEMQSQAINAYKDLIDALEEDEKARKEETENLLGGVSSLSKQTTNLISMGKEMTKGFDNFLMGLSNITRSLENNLDKVISTFLNAQEQFYYGFNGLAGGARSNYSAMMSNFSSVMGHQNYVNQSSMFENMKTLVNSGIVDNVEQRAFLQTLAKDFGMGFDNSNNQMNRLIRIQHEDYTANRIAIEYSLKEFLNQNFKTSEYIREGFQNATDALLQSQSLMTSKLASAYEATVQTWLGSYYSVGVSSQTTGKLADAINRIGSGNIEGLGNQGDISTLLMMGASRMGMNIGELLNGGYTSEQDINKLMTGVSRYLVEMGANSSNVVKNQLSRVFGVDISDIAAIARNGVNFNGGANANIGYALSGMTDLVPNTKRLTNNFENFMFDWGSRLASNTNMLMWYEINKRIVEPLGSIVYGIGDAIGDLKPGGTAMRMVGLGMQNANLITMLPSLLGAGWDFGTNLLGLGYNSLGSIYENLGRGADAVKITTSDSGVSGSMAINKTGGVSEMLSSSKLGANDALSQIGMEEVESEENPNEPINIIRDGVVQIVDILLDIQTWRGDVKFAYGNGLSSSTPPII